MRSSVPLRFLTLAAVFGSAVLLAGSAHAKFCRGILDNHEYECTAKSEKGQKFELDLEFSDPGLAGDKFSVLVNDRAVGACSCEVKYQVVKGKTKVVFNAANSFHCYVPGLVLSGPEFPYVGGPEAECSGSDFVKGSGQDADQPVVTFLVDQASYSGLATKNSKTGATGIKQGEAVDACGQAIIFNCVEDNEKDEPVCAGGPCSEGGDCTSQFCKYGVCQPVAAGGSCLCGGDCTSKFCKDGVCQSVCAGGACVYGGDCTSQFCDNGTCAPVAASGACLCGGDCTSQNCQGGTCQANCAGGACVYGGDCTSQFCDNGTCGAVDAGGSCLCGGDCLSQFCQSDNTCG